MTPITFTEALRIKQALSLTPVETAILVAVLDGWSREGVRNAAHEFGQISTLPNSKSFTVCLSKLNAKLPHGAKIHAVDARGRTGSAMGGAPAVAYKLATADRDALLRIARGDQERAAA